MNARELTGAGLVRALRGAAAGPAVARAVAARADTLAAAIAAKHPGATVTVTPREAAEAAVMVSAGGLFAREFGSLASAPDPVIGPAIDEVSGR
ncbi:MAG: hypothetical protein J0H94_14855 [Rhizobiales bacterium]|nr:hypothetical protein [Hyphomicrobiales bacterium]